MKNIKRNRLYLKAGKSTQNWVNEKKLSVSIDQITIIAPISLDSWERCVHEWLKLPFIESSNAGLRVIDTDNCYYDDLGNKHNYVCPEQVAYIEMPKYHLDEIRIDFNPNHGMKSEGGKWLKNVLLKLPNKHFSRLDIAIDIFNYRDVQKYDFHVFGMTKQVYYNRRQEIETKYWGSRSSQKQVRLYNKKVEQVKRHGKITLVNSWWRMEFQLRNNAINNYPNIVRNMLRDFYIPNYLDPSLTDSEQNKVLRMMIDKDYYGSKSKSTQQRLRKLMRLAKTDNSLSIALEQVFVDSLDFISEELEYYLECFNVN